MAEPDSLSDARARVLAAAEAIYRLTDFASFDPALKLSLRRHATEVLGGVTGMAFFTAVRRSGERERIRALIGATCELIRFAGRRGLIAPGNVSRVTAAYDTADGHLAAMPEAVPLPVPDAPAEPFIPNERQDKILAYLATGERAQLGDIRGLFGDAYSEKTLQRDLLQLVGAGFIQRQGDNRWTVYSLRQRGQL